MVLNRLEEELEGSGLAVWSRPKGGYFISLDTLAGCAKRTVQLAKEAGVTLTGAGATYPLQEGSAGQKYPHCSHLSHAGGVKISHGHIYSVR